MQSYYFPNDYPSILVIFFTDRAKIKEEAPPDLPEGGGVQTASLPEPTVTDRREVRERSSLTPNPL